MLSVSILVHEGGEVVSAHRDIPKRIDTLRIGSGDVGRDYRVVSFSLALGTYGAGHNPSTRDGLIGDPVDDRTRQHGGRHFRAGRKNELEGTDHSVLEKVLYGRLNGHAVDFVGPKAPLHGDSQGTAGVTNADLTGLR